jgi:hypothetical protein
MGRMGSLIVAASIVGMGIAVPGAVLQSAKAEAAVQATTPASDPVAAEFFRVTWTASPARGGQSRITGYVYNDWWTPADNLVLRINELDASGQLIGAVGRPLVETITPHGRLYFDVKVPRADSYDVGVSMFGFTQGP